MSLILKLFFDICLLRANAENVPASRALLIISVLAYFVLSLAITFIEGNLSKIVAIILVGFILVIALAQAGLWIRSFLNRSVQTITALAGTGTIFCILTWPLALLGEHWIFARYLLLLIFIWDIIVVGHILRNALSLPFWAGIGISVFYIFTYFRIVRVFFIAQA
jgi:hypothetical protein